MRRSFELVSDLKVNFYKCKLFSINLDLEESNGLALANPLNCNLGELPFKYFGISVGVNLGEQAHLRFFA